MLSGVDEVPPRDEAQVRSLPREGVLLLGSLSR